MADKMSTQTFEIGACIEWGNKWVTVACDGKGSVYRAFFSDQQCKKPVAEEGVYGASTPVACTDSEDGYVGWSTSPHKRLVWTDFNCLGGPMVVVKVFKTEGCAEAGYVINNDRPYEEGCTAHGQFGTADKKWSTHSVSMSVTDGKVLHYGSYSTTDCTGPLYGGGSVPAFACGECLKECGDDGVCSYVTWSVQWGSNVLCSAPTTTKTTSAANLPSRAVASSTQPSATNLCFGAAATLLAAFAAAFGA
mmetsp:Transcript_42485/g.133971  ORF Transcript_42485/g.133971 Transcript_42485/m.133971 type:complete len:249 (+) Transcript_42485:185-931(+)|eukprot:CAMPEP_0204213114 /NCGR_PEP_ID=MMETSP0361-20130328/75759_1 /ASSEMBLY_ACC=CAM_ASM_000343 /TAXON_ID=268821 /ORGANISM="Scrippsiella Hangoei, Strain SHTV-5" /LENGTH=248 /DNA_ID=CAMNT_0051177543 /DNA_START=108 /DNA_END=854 /DNA_ORIENTATION=-